MLSQMRRLWGRFLNQSRTIDNEPLNKVSLIVVISIDLFILVNVFSGLENISQWHLSPAQAYPCYGNWENYRTQTNQEKDYEMLRRSIFLEPQNNKSLQETYQQAEAGHLGKVSATCLEYATLQDKINNPQNRNTAQNIDQTQQKISTLDRANQNIRAQYDSTLLEKIAGQDRDKSINSVGAEKAKQELDRNNREITNFKTKFSKLKTELLSKPESGKFLALLKDETQFTEVKIGEQKASFWYPSIQLAFQSLFLLPLIVIALSVHQFAQRRRYGLISLISWHLLVIFFIPLIFKIFEFLQIGAIFKFVTDLIRVLFGGLLFLVSYVYILLIPAIGFGIIKFFQKVVFNPKVQAASRVQKSRCLNCGKKLRQNEAYCPHCGYSQYCECPSCHGLTYKHLPYCQQCGTAQDSNL
jgi:zinc-ribbon domain